MRICLLMLSLIAAAAFAQDPPEVTDDGLVRSVSGAKVGVYRLPVATFHQYRRIALDPITVEFKKGWKHHHPEVTAKERAKLIADLAGTFRAELVKELVDRGGYQLTATPAPDVLRVAGSILNMDIAAPEASIGQQQKTFVTSAGSMKTVVELKDAMSGVVVARIISFEEAPERRDVLRDFQRNPNAMPPATTPLTNLADFRLGFEHSARYTHEAISVAKSEKREEQSQIKSEN